MKKICKQEIFFSNLDLSEFLVFFSFRLISDVPCFQVMNFSFCSFQCLQVSCITARKVLSSLLEKEQRISACLILAQTFLLQDWMNPTKKSCTEVRGVLSYFSCIRRTHLGFSYLSFESCLKSSHYWRGIGNREPSGRLWKSVVGYSIIVKLFSFTVYTSMDILPYAYRNLPFRGALRDCKTISDKFKG